MALGVLEAEGRAEAALLNHSYLPTGTELSGALPAGGATPVDLYMSALASSSSAYKRYGRVAAIL